MEVRQAPGGTALPDMPTGQLIRLYRIDRKKSTVNVATLAGITVRYLEMIEAGTKTPSLPVLRKLAKVLRPVRDRARKGWPLTGQRWPAV
jgi:DNA-binding XRE family transcriptional regulator